MKHLVMFPLVAALAGSAPGCVECEAWVEWTNDTDAPHTLRIRGIEHDITGETERDFAPGEVYVWTVTWQVEPVEEQRLNFDYYLDGERCGAFTIVDNEERESGMWFCD